MGKKSGLVNNFGVGWPKIESCEKLLKNLVRGDRLEATCTLSDHCIDIIITALHLGI